MRNNVYSDIMLIQGYANIPVSGKKNENFQNFMYNIYDKLWGDDITNSLIWIFIRTGQEMFSEKMWNFKMSMSQLPYFLSDFHHFCTNLWGNFYSFFWNYGNSGLDFPFKSSVLARILKLIINHYAGRRWSIFAAQACSEISSSKSFGIDKNHLVKW